MQKGINKGHVASKGFTLIELLVVIAIIGILAGIVLASLGSARSKGGDAAVQGDLVGIRSQAELYASNNSNQYSPSVVATTTAATCTATGLFSDNTVKSAIAGAVAASGGLAACGAGPGYWVVAVQLKTDTSKAWCVSSSGASQQITWGTGVNGTPGTTLNSAATTCL